MRRLSSRAYSHGQLLGNRLNEATHDRRHGLVLVEASAHEVEELVGAHLGDGGFVPHLNVIGAHVDVGVCVGTRNLVDEQGVAQDVDLE